MHGGAEPFSDLETERLYTFYTSDAFTPLILKSILWVTQRQWRDWRTDAGFSEHARKIKNPT